ncbi:hypothetical protein PhCBS80983_g02588 [Powellomyces hirtus]|uniref:Uncharacterized protein n=1 Tax=Powellomyces hirtus TaxID=109895 RepID=A0A507E586_9FUNG|nr:hypothetical protein PhCBS80983_g02588 [Powellomyces hirtus]
MRFLRTATHLSARAMRRAKPSAAFRAANMSAMGSGIGIDPAARIFASINQHTAAMHSLGGAAPSVLEALKDSTTASISPSGCGILAILEEAEDEESHCNTKPGRRRAGQTEFVDDDHGT